MTKENIAEIMRTWAGLNFAQIPKGEFIIGSKEDNELAWNDEKPQHKVEIPYDYWAGKFPLSFADYNEFVQSTSYVTRAEKDGWCWVWNVEETKWGKIKGANWKNPFGDSGDVDTLDHYPVVQVCWYDARAFCEWLNQKHNDELPKGYHFRLPSETEWEKAARGLRGNEWPWGNEFDPGLCNSRESGRIYPIKIGTYSPEGDSEFSVADMSGNIWEWTITLWGDDRNTPSYVYPYLIQDGRENQSAGEEYYRIIRGGSYKDDLKAVRSACRDIDPPHYSLSNLGFRVFVAPIMTDESTN